MSILGREIHQACRLLTTGDGMQDLDPCGDVEITGVDMDPWWTLWWTEPRARPALTNLGVQLHTTQWLYDFNIFQWACAWQFRTCLKSKDDNKKEQVPNCQG